MSPSSDPPQGHAGPRPQNGAILSPTPKHPRERKGERNERNEKKDKRQSLVGGPVFPPLFTMTMVPTTPHRIYLVTGASKVGVGSCLSHGGDFEKQNETLLQCSRKFTPEPCRM